MLARKQLRLIPWARLRSGHGDGATHVREDLRALLFDEGDGGVYERFENQVESQGHLFEFRAPYSGTSASARKARVISAASSTVTVSGAKATVPCRPAAAKAHITTPFT